LSAHAYGLLADITVVIHATFVVFVVIGQLFILAGWLRAWRWPRGVWFRTLHLGAIVFVVGEAWLGVICPLTRLEYYWRRLAGEGGEQMSFVGRAVRAVLFYDAPGWVFTGVYTVFALLVVVSFVGYPPLWQRTRRR
jgi:hypothetical protein